MKRLPAPPVYHTVLVTAWQERGRDPMKWRYTLEDTATGERYGFANWHELIAALGEQMTHSLDKDARASNK